MSNSTPNKNNELKDQIRKEFEYKFGNYAIMGKAGRIYNGGFINGASMKEAQDFIGEVIDKCVEETRKIDHSIDVRYEADVEKAFNKFIKKWCGSYYGHLIDDDENDGEFMREKIRGLVEETRKEMTENLKKSMTEELFAIVYPNLQIQSTHQTESTNQL